jgi:hypothetical protein
MDAMSDEQWPGAEDLRRQLKAQLALEARFPGWQVLHAMNERWVRYVRIPQASFYAVHDRLGELPLVGGDLDQLAALIERREHERQQVMQWIARSDLAVILSMIRRFP